MLKSSSREEFKDNTLSKAIGVYLHDLFGCNVRFRYLKQSKGIAVEVYYPKRYSGIRIGIPELVLKNADRHSAHREGGRF